MYLQVGAYRKGVLVVKGALLVCRINYSHWRGNKRILVSFLLAAVLCFLLTEKIMNFAHEKDTILMALEPFIWSFEDGQSIMLSSLILILLFADMPLLDGSVPYYLIRINRKQWLTGQLMYVISATILYLVFVFTVTALLCSELAYPGNVWSDTAAKLGYTDAGEVLAVPAVIHAMEMSRPYKCAAMIAGLMLGYTLMSVLVMFIVNMWKGQLVAVVSVAGLHLFGILLNPSWITSIFHLSVQQQSIAQLICGWLSPIRQATFHCHNFGYDSLPRLWQSFVYFGVIAVVLIILLYISIRRYNFYFVGTELD